MLLQLSLMAMMAGALPAEAGHPIPDPSTGVIDGKRAVMALPVSIDAPDVPLDPAGCEAHLVPVNEPDTERVFPCGEWFAPPPANYQIWLEKGDAITPFPLGLHYSGSEFTGKGLIGLTPIGPAGWVKPKVEGVHDETHSVRLLAIESHLRHGNIVRRAFQRRTMPDNKRPVTMPTGKTLAGAFDEKGNAIALSRPVLVKKGATVDLAIAKPASGSDLLLILERPRRATHERPDVITLRLEMTSSEDASAPDVMVNASDAVYAVWYGVDSGRATIRVESDTLFHDSVELTLHANGVSTVRSRLGVRPAIDVSIVAPPSRLDDEEWLVRIEDDGNVLREVEASRGSGIRVEALPAKPLNVRLDVGSWHFLEPVDLSGGEDESVEFVLKPLIVSGRVTQGDEPVRAEVQFSTRRDEYEAATTGENGDYELLLWQARQYPVFVRVLDSSGPPLFDFVKVVDSRTLDFELPDSVATVLVDDQRSGRPVPGAKVAFANIWEDPAMGQRKTGQQTDTDAEGVAVSPPLRAGELQVAVRAPGYMVPEPLTRQVLEEADLDLRVSLVPFEEGSKCRIVLSSGEPATGAELVVFSPGDESRIFWQGTANAEGEVAIPDNVEGHPIFVRHPEAASAIEYWSATVGSPTITLLPAVDPLTLRVQLAAGVPARHSELAIWIDGRRVSGPALGYLTWSKFRTDRNGIWTGRGLACSPQRLLAYARPSLRPAVDSGLYDSLAETITCPWPNAVQIEAIE